MYAVKDNRTTYLDRLIELGSDVCARNNVGFSCFTSFYSASKDTMLLIIVNIVVVVVVVVRIAKRNNYCESKWIIILFQLMLTETAISLISERITFDEERKKEQRNKPEAFTDTATIKFDIFHFIDFLRIVLQFDFCPLLKSTDSTIRSMPTLESVCALVLRTLWLSNRLTFDF